MTGPKPEKAFVDRINDLAESWKARLGPWRNNTKNTRPLLIASDCSGYGSDVIALRLLGLHREVQSVMTCEKDAVKVALHRAVSECCGIAFDETAHHSDIFDRQDRTLSSRGLIYIQQATPARAIPGLERKKAHRTVGVLSL